MTRSRYLLEDKLGAGGMGVVYRALDRLTNQYVALKQVASSAEQLNFASQDNDDDLAQALAHEFRTLASLRHPNIISVLDYGFDSHRQPYFTMTLLEKSQTIIQAGQGQPLDRQISLLIQMLEALVYLHRRGILHRDLKPANVLVINGQVVVLDFGLASAQENTASTPVGTLHYLAPELLRQAPSSEASDLYAAGMIAYQLLTGIYPFRLDNLTELLDDIQTTEPDISHLRALPVGIALSDTISQLLAKDPQKRPHSAQEVIRLLANASGQSVPDESAAIREGFLQAAPFVGRTAELSLLRQAMIETKAGNGCAWLIVGESGVGKSRLLEELAIEALVQGLHCLRGQNIQDGNSLYQLWRDILRQVVLLAEPDTAEAGILKPWVMDIDLLLGRPVPDVFPLDGIAGQQRLIATIAQLFRRIGQPVLLILEDLHWATDSLEIVKAIIRLVNEVPLMIVGSYRNDECPILPDQLSAMQRLHLKRLNIQETEQLTVSMLGTAGQRTNVTRLIHREAEGNAFFIVEVVRALAETAGNLNLIGQTTLPNRVFVGGIQRIIQHRLERIPPADYMLLKIAAVAGRQIDVDLIRAVTGADDLDRWLVACNNRSVLFVQDGQWYIAHDKLRETILAELSDEERPRLHRQVAEAIERIYPNRPTDTTALMEHWHIAGYPLKEAGYALIAGQQAWAISNFAQVELLGKRALALLPATGESNLRIRLLLLLGEACEGLSNYAEATTWYQASLRFASERNNQIEIAAALGKLGHMGVLQADYERAAAYLNQSLTMMRELENTAGVIKALVDLTWLAGNQGDWEATRRFGQEGIVLARASGDQRSIEMILQRAGWTIGMQGDYVTAAQYFKESRDFAREIDDRWGCAQALFSLAWAVEKQGDWATAQAYYMQSQTLAQETGNRWTVAEVLRGRGRVAGHLNNWAEAYALFEQSLAMAEDIGDQRGVADTHCSLGMVSLKLNKIDSARSHLRAALRIAWATREMVMIFEALANFIRLHLAVGELQRAAELLGFVSNDPAAPGYVVEPLTDVRVELETRLQPELCASAGVYGQLLTLERVVLDRMD